MLPSKLPDTVPRMTSPAPDPLAWFGELEGVPSAFAATRDGIDALLRDRGLRRTSPEQTGESLLRGAHASAVLAGSTSTLEEVRAGTGDEIAQAAVRVSTELLSWCPVLVRSPVQAFARLHVLAAGSGAPGRPRPRRGCSRCRRRCCDEAPALLVAAVVHAEWPPPGRSRRTTGWWPAPPSGWCSWPGASTRPRSSYPRRGTWRCARRTSPTCAATRRGRAGLHAWLLYAAEAQARAPRRARCGAA